MNQGNKLYTKIAEIVKTAGEILRKARLSEDQIFHKEGTANFVTQYDTRIQQFLMEKFQKLFPEAHFLAEEEGVRQELGKGYCFIIDPLDGTTNFVHDLHYSCISVGLAYGGKMVYGAVYNPYLNELYTAEAGRGAFLNGQPIHASEQGLKENVVLFGCARNYEDTTDTIFSYAKRLYLRGQAVRCGGSAALEICRVAAGRAGTYVELRLYPWDYAAAGLVLEEAGGRITKIDGTPLSLEASGSVLAGGRKCWEESREVLKDA